MTIELSPIEIARLEEHRQAVATADVAVESEQVGGGWMSFAGRGSWANQACSLGLNGAVSDHDMDRLVEFYASRGVERRIEVCAFADESLIRGLADRGFVLREFENVLARPLSDAGDLRALHPYDWPTDLTMERVNPDNDDQVEAHARVAMSGFIDGELPPAMLETARRSTRHPRTVAFNAMIDGEIVGSGAMEATDVLSALFGVSVLPSYRRRGIQLALILERLACAREHGCRVATIHSRPGIPTERNASRVGFELSYAKAVLVHPGEGLEPSP